MNLDDCLKQFPAARLFLGDCSCFLCSQETAIDNTYRAWLHFNKNFITNNEILIHKIMFWIHAICTYKIFF